MYLVIVLGLGVLSVVFVILVISTFHLGDKPVSSCLGAIGRLIARIICNDKCSCCHKKQNPDTVTPITESKKLPAEMQLEDDETTETPMTYQAFSVLLDRFFFFVYLTIVTVTTFLFSLLGFVHFASLWLKLYMPFLTLFSRALAKICVAGIGNFGERSRALALFLFIHCLLL